MSTDRLAAFVAQCWGEPRALHLEVRALRGGLESAGVAEVKARFFDARDRQRSAAFVVKALEGTPAREADIYQNLVAPLGGGIAPALLGIERDGPARCLLFLERVRPVRRWPWRDETAARRLLERLAHLHAAVAPAKAWEILSDWDYESELTARTRRALEVLEELPREDDLAPLRRRLGSLRRIGEALPEIRRQLLAFNPLGKTAIHGDAHPGNALVRSGERPVLLDWGRTRLGSPLEDVSSWLQCLGYWEPAAKRRHDTLLAGYLAARGLPARADREMRDAYWLAGASNALSGALLVHLWTALDAPSGSRQRSAAVRAAADALRVIHRAHACWREDRVPRGVRGRQTKRAGLSLPPNPAP
jgi:aminoglycoside phosphotransferase (APT) family kinase protein